MCPIYSIPNPNSPMATTVHQTYKLQTYTVHTRQYTIRLASLFIIYRNYCDTPSADDTTFVALSARMNPYLFSFSLGLLPIGSNCHANSA